MNSFVNEIHAKTILIATQNQKKREEILAIVGKIPGIIFRNTEDFPFIPVVEEDGKTFRENAIKKATTLAKACNTWAMADDSGLEIQALKGRPGVLSSRYSGTDATDKSNIQKVLSELYGVTDEKRTARFVCSIALADPHQLLFVVEDYCEGFITKKASGTGGFGYDPIFCIPYYNQTLAELSQFSASVKNKISHRAKALQQFKERIVPLLRNR
ncbi:MAG: RdgB/HAM1 family non-canonical purine NTP pyrophosphatase [Planctomycetes bacterium]|nr:RdgB/HAM1 family non-canonical purine NTP pyrophosphatase [Planctomycetota bacterium]